MTDLSYMVALTVPPPELDTLAAIQQRLRPVGWKITIGPHVTLIPPGAGRAPLSTAMGLFNEAAANLSPLKLSYPDLGVFKRRGLATVFMKPIATDDLYELQRRLQILASSWQDVSRSYRRPFVPHVTLVNRLPESEVDSTIEQLRFLVPTEITFDQPKLFSKRETDTEWLQINWTQIIIFAWVFVFIAINTLNMGLVN
jgi:2'-5' RNA ligase